MTLGTADDAVDVRTGLQADALRQAAFRRRWRAVKHANKEPRRFLALANPGLRELLDDTIGDGWLVELERLRDLEPYAGDASVLPTTFARRRVSN